MQLIWDWLLGHLIFKLSSNFLQNLPATRCINLIEADMLLIVVYVDLVLKNMRFSWVADEAAWKMEVKKTSEWEGSRKETWRPKYARGSNCNLCATIFGSVIVCCCSLLRYCWRLLHREIVSGNKKSTVLQFSTKKIK